MKNRTNLVVFLLIFIMVISSINSIVFAEYSFNDPEVPEESKESASLLFKTLSLTFLSLEALERNRIGDVRQMKFKIQKNLEEVLRKQNIIKEKTSKKKIYQGMISPDRLPMIMRDFDRYKIEFPRFKNELPDIAIQQIEVFSGLISSIEFGDNASENRKLIRSMINEIWRIVVLGVDLSEIAASID